MKQEPVIENEGEDALVESENFLLRRRHWLTVLDRIPSAGTIGDINLWLRYYRDLTPVGVNLTFPTLSSPSHYRDLPLWVDIVSMGPYVPKSQWDYLCTFFPSVPDRIPPQDTSTENGAISPLQQPMTPPHDASSLLVLPPTAHPKSAQKKE